MKTIREWIERLPEPIRAKFIANTEVSRFKMLYPSFEEAMYHAFTWIYSPEGEEYWVKVKAQYDEISYKSKEVRRCGKLPLLYNPEVKGEGWVRTIEEYSKAELEIEEKKCVLVEDYDGAIKYRDRIKELT